MKSWRLFLYIYRPISKSIKFKTNKELIPKNNGPTTIHRNSYNERFGPTPLVIITPDTQNEEVQNGNNWFLWVKNIVTKIKELLSELKFKYQNFIFRIWFPCSQFFIAIIRNQISQETIKEDQQLLKMLFSQINYLFSCWNILV